MVEYSKAERNLIDDCLDWYRIHMHPEYTLDRNDPETILLILQHCHDKGQFIRTPQQHEMWFRIQEKNGIKVERDAERQKRLEAERAKIRAGIILEAAKKEAEEAEEIAAEKKEEVKKVEIQLKQIEAEEKGVAKAVIEAEKGKLEAEQKAKSAEEEIAKLKAELAKAQQKAKELENSKAAIEELAKGTEAKIEENSEQSEDLEEKSIEELVDELKVDES